jgi:hypothetical protein
MNEGAHSQSLRQRRQSLAREREGDLLVQERALALGGRVLLSAMPDAIHTSWSMKGL